MSALLIAALTVLGAVVVTQVGPWWLALGLWAMIVVGVVRGLLRD